MKDWHFNVLFVLAVVGAVVMLFGSKLGIEVRPEVVGVFGLVMAFILQQKDSNKGTTPAVPPAPPAEDPATSTEEN